MSSLWKDPDPAAVPPCFSHSASLTVSVLVDGWSSPSSLVVVVAVVAGRRRPPPCVSHRPPCISEGSLSRAVHVVFFWCLVGAIIALTHDRLVGVIVCAIIIAMTLDDRDRYWHKSFVPSSLPSFGPRHRVTLDDRDRHCLVSAS